MKSVSINDSQAVFGRNECLYQCVLDDYENADFIGIITYNIWLVGFNELKNGDTNADGILIGSQLLPPMED